MLMPPTTMVVRTLRDDRLNALTSFSICNVDTARSNTECVGKHLLETSHRPHEFLHCQLPFAPLFYMHEQSAASICRQYMRCR